MIRSFISHLPNIRGKQRLLVVLDSILGPVRMKARHGVCVEGFPSSAQDTAFLRPVSENQCLEREIQGLGESSVFIDCGANCGFYSAVAAQSLGNDGLIVSIEPSHREYRRLLCAIEMNPYRCQWLPLHMAVGKESGIIAMDTEVGHTGMNRVAQFNKPGSASTFQWTIDEIVAATIGVDRNIDLMKIDVEGYELHVLKGAQETLRRRQVKVLVVEITDKFLQEQGHGKAQLYDYLNFLGYKDSINSSEWQYDEIFRRCDAVHSQSTCQLR